MVSLLETIERLRRNEAVSETELRAHQNSSNAVERFLAHNALSLVSMQAGRDHLLDALRAIDYADQRVLQTYLDLSRILNQTAGVALATARYALAMADRKQWSAAFEAISQAVRFDLAHEGELSHDQAVWSDLSNVFEEASRTLGRSVHASPHTGGPVRVGLLTSHLKDDSATERFIAGWMRHANRDIATLRLYSTESEARPARHELMLVPESRPSSESGARLIEQLRARRVDTWFAPAGADALQTSRILVERIVRDQIELLLVDSTLADAAIGITVAGKPAARQVAIDRGAPMPLSGIDEVIHVNTHSYGDEDPIWKQRGIRSSSIFQGIEPSTSTPAARRDYGLSDDAIVMMTCTDDMSRTCSIPFVKMVARLLAENPRAVYLVAGEGNTGSLKAIFDAAGVSKRVGFASRLRDPGAFVAMADLYLAEFPASSRDGVLTAMSVGKPVMILSGDYDQPGNARFVGGPFAVVGSHATLLDRCGAMLRDPQLRRSVGATLKARATQKFSMKSTIQEMMRLASEVEASRVQVDCTPVTEVAPLRRVA